MVLIHAWIRILEKREKGMREKNMCGRREDRREKIDIKRSR